MKAWREDFVTIENTQIKNGILQGLANIGRAGIQQYTDKNGSVISELRLPEDIEKSTDIFSNLPVTLNHPTEMITEKNADELVKGFNSETKYKNGWLISPVNIHKKDAIASALSTHKQFSLGYWCEVIDEPGEWEDVMGIQGEKGKIYQYDRIQKNHEGNHLALVEKARAGDRATFVKDGQVECRLDELNESINEVKMNDKKAWTQQDLDKLNLTMELTEKKKEQLDMDNLVSCDLGQFGCHVVPSPVAELLNKVYNAHNDMTKYRDLFNNDEMLYEKMKPIMMDLASGKCDINKMCDMFSNLVRNNSLTIEIENEAEEQMDKQETENTAKIDQLQSELVQLKALLNERSDDNIEKRIEAESKARLDAYNQAAKYLDTVAFDATKPALGWYQLAIEKVTNLDTKDMTEVEIKGRFDMLTLVHKPTVEDADKKLQQATSKKQEQYQISYTLPQDKPCGMVFH